MESLFAIKSDRDFDNSIVRSMLNQTIEKNRGGAISTVIMVPGLVKMMGPDNTFTSTCQQFHGYDGLMKKSVDNCDHTVGLKKNDVSDWTEAALKSNTKAFVSGGTLKR